MPTALRLDFETRSTNNLPKCGLYNYADDTNTGVYMLGYKFDEEPTQVWINDGRPFPAAIIDHVVNGGDVWAFNAAFERQIWNQVLCQEHPHIPQLTIEQCFCTKAQGLANGLPSKLDNQAKALGVPIAKDKIGADLIRKYSILNVLWDDIPEDDQDLFVKYCAKDVEVEKAVGGCCRELSAAEWEDYHNIERMNDRGIQVDLDFAEAALKLADKVRQEVTGNVIALTGGVVTKITQRKSRDAWILPKLTDYQLETITNEKGNPSFDESSRRALCAYDDLDDGVRQYLTLLEEAGGSTIGKYEAMVRAEVEGKVYGAFTHNAAHTGRASSQLVQLQNMKRPVFSDDEAEQLMDRVIAGDDDFDSVVETLALLVRHAIYEDDGMTAMDYSSVEYIVLMWLAGDQEAMDDYAAGVDAYVKLAAKIYHKAAEDVTKMERHTAKIVLLACGFGGGVGAVKSMAEGYDVIISDDEAQGLVDGYRSANPYVKQLWDDIRSAIRDAVRNPRTEFAICDGKVTYESDGTDLWCQLPSGRLLRYMNVNYEFVDPPWDGDPIPSVTYQNNSILPKAGAPDWPRSNLSHINGSENLTQAIANDLLRDAIAVCEEEQLDTFLMVHDELVVRGEHEQLMKEIMETTPEWADDMPLRADGRFSYIYGK